MLFQSTLPVGGATRNGRAVIHREHISIHAPRGGSDVDLFHCKTYTAISIHAPRGGSDSIARIGLEAHIVFQSTLPVGGATNLCDIMSTVVKISIHAPRGGSDRSGSWA